VAWLLTCTAAWLFVAAFGGMAVVSVTMMLVLVPLELLRGRRLSQQ
jgi:hypothetical protein